MSESASGSMYLISILGLFSGINGSPPKKNGNILPIEYLPKGNISDILFRGFPGIWSFHFFFC